MAQRLTGRDWRSGGPRFKSHPRLTTSQSWSSYQLNQLGSKAASDSTLKQLTTCGVSNSTWTCCTSASRNLHVFFCRPSNSSRCCFPWSHGSYRQWTGSFKRFWREFRFGPAHLASEAFFYLLPFYRIFNKTRGVFRMDNPTRPAIISDGPAACGSIRQTIDPYVTDLSRWQDLNIRADLKFHVF